MGRKKKEKIVGIYCIENIINGKKYVGQSQDVIKRMKQKHQNCRFLEYAINHYGVDNFKRYIIEQCPIDIISEREIYWIKELHSHVSEWGYNLSWGGEAIMRGLHHTEETKRKISENLPDNSGDKNPMWNREVSIETRQKISEALSGENHYNFGHHRSEETCKKIAIGREGKYEKENSPAFNTKRVNASSQFFGVHRNETKGYVYWRATMRYGKEFYRIGNYKSEIDAAKAYDKFVVEHNFKNRLNFPADYLDMT